MKRTGAVAALALALVGAGSVSIPADAARNGYVLDRRVQDPRITESSGLARSTYARGLLWTHGDSGDAPRIFGIGRAGKTRAVVRLRGATNVDFEDMSSGPGHSLWVGDIGDDSWSRPHVTVYKIKEPRRLGRRGVAPTAYRLAFPDGPRNAEALLVHPRTGRVFVVSKQAENAGVYAAPEQLSTTNVNTLTRIADAPSMVTAGTFTPNGRDVVLSNYDNVFVSAGFHGERTIALKPTLALGESVEVSRSGETVLVGSEGARSPIFKRPAPRGPEPTEPTPAPEPTTTPTSEPTTTPTSEPTTTPTSEPTTTPTSKPTTTPTSTPTSAPADLPGIGVYNGSPNESPDETTVRELGHTPDVANTYYQYNSNLNMTYETARIKRGTSPNISIATNGTQLIAGVAKGDPAAISWLDGWISKLAKLAAVDPDVPVYATLDQEMRVRTRLGKITGESADPLVYGKALDVFFKRANAAHPNIETTYWFVGYDRTFEGAVGQSFTRDPDAILFDPYANGPSDTVASITRADMAWIKSQPWYHGQTVGLAEFGMPVANGDTAMGNFFRNVPSQLESMDIDWAVLFNRTKDNDHQITHRPDGKLFPKAVASFKESMAQSG